MWWQQWVLPHVARLRLCEKIRGVNRRHYRERNSRNHQRPLKRDRSGPTGNEMQGQHERITSNNKSALHQPTAPLWSGEDQMETFRVFEIPDEQPARDCQKTAGNNWRDP